LGCIVCFLPCYNSCTGGYQLHMLAILSTIIQNYNNLWILHVLLMGSLHIIESHKSIAMQSVPSDSQYKWNHIMISCFQKHQGNSQFWCPGWNCVALGYIPHGPQYGFLLCPITLNSGACVNGIYIKNLETVL
jgi:hypothetical protein